MLQATSDLLSRFTPSKVYSEWLAGMGIIRAHGADASKFLHSQLTQDIQSMQVGQLRLAAYCSAKGRTLAVFYVLKLEPDELLLITRRPMVQPMIKRLSMFILRAKVTLSNVSDEWSLLAWFWPNADKVPALLATKAMSVRPVQELSNTMLLSQTCVNHSFAHRGCLLLPRSQVLSTKDWLQALFHQSVQTQPSDGPTELLEAEGLWDREEMLAGIPHLEQATSELFTPETINLDLVDGVHFLKGCYPGQEVVARAHYLGKHKRRMLLGCIPFTQKAPIPGQDVFQSGEQEAVGRVVNVSNIDPMAMPNHPVLLLMEVSLPDQFSQANFCLDTEAKTEPIQLLSLPYEFPSPKARPPKL